MKKTDFYTNFKNPSEKYRSAPFWAWNDKLDKTEIKRQIREMKKQGIGGFFIHSRDGLETQYLSLEWFECVKTAVETAKELNMYAWLYDEDRWPSGSCGGTITQNPEYACKGLTLEVTTNVPDLAFSNILAIYKARIENDEIQNLKRLSLTNNIEPIGEETLLIVRLEICEGSEWFNFSPPPDNLNPDTTSEFIKSTHERYKAVVGDEFGKTVPGIFTDEPSLADRHCAFNPNRGWIPWTCDFDNYFIENCGYDPFDEIPYLYFNHERSRKIRHDYWKTVSLRFKKSYSDVISRWCGENNLKFTGHFLQEDKLGLSCRVNGSIMPHYASQDVPAIDMLTEKCEEYMTVKQCVSIARQMGKKTVLSESYGCTGWDFGFEGQKWVGDWQYALGVNMRCQHLALYSLKGCRKRDYPPSINANNSWWKHYKTVEDYFARCSYMLRQGKAVCEVLVIHPMSTVWSILGCDPYGNPKRNKERDVPLGNALGAKLNELLKSMCKQHYDYDLGDELIIKDYACVENNMFTVGECKYSTIIIPYCENLLSSTVKKLTEFMNNGGKVLGVAPFTKYTDGETSKAAYNLTIHKNYISLDSEKELFTYLSSNFEKAVSVTDANGAEETDILHQLRQDDLGYILFLANNNRKCGHRLNIKLKAERKYLYRADLLNGELKRVQFTKNEKYIEFSECLKECGSEMFYLTDNNFEVDFKDEEAFFKEEIPLVLKNYKTENPNLLTLDSCGYSLNGVYLGECEVWKAQFDIRKRLEMRQIHLNGLEQRYRWINKPHKNDGQNVELCFEFQSESSFDECKLIVENPECFEIYLDGKSIDNKSFGYLFDKEFKTVNLPTITEGRHKITLKCKYKNSTELENCYLAGNFGVTADRCLCELPKHVSLGDITQQGFLHYGGDFDYMFECDISDLSNDIYIDIGAFKGACAYVKINQAEINVPWKANSVINITKNLRIGKNEIIVGISASLRNLLGPLHITNKPEVTKDSCFAPSGDNYTNNYITSECGLYDIKLFKKGKRYKK